MSLPLSFPSIPPLDFEAKMEIGFEFPLMLNYVTSHMVQLFKVASMCVGRIFIVVFLICSISRLVFRGDAIDSLAGRLFALGVEWLQCLFSPILEWYGTRMVKYHQLMRESAFEKKDKDGSQIHMAQNGIIEWTAILRFLQGLVHNFFDEEKVETAVEKRRRYFDSDLSECSDPERWQELHHGADDDSSESSLADEDWLVNYQRAFQRALNRAWDKWHAADAHSNYEMNCHYENIIDTLIQEHFVLWT